MRKIKKILSIIICMALCSCLLPMGTAKAATDFKAKATFIKFDDNGGHTETSLGEATVVFNNANKPYDTYNPEDGLVLSEYTINEGDPYSQAGVIVDDGYDTFE